MSGLQRLQCVRVPGEAWPPASTCGISSSSAAGGSSPTGSAREESTGSNRPARQSVPPGGQLSRCPARIGPCLRLDPRSGDLVKETAELPAQVAPAELLEVSLVALPVRFLQ